jgi:hypothetical protein
MFTTIHIFVYIVLLSVKKPAYYFTQIWFSILELVSQ